MKSFIFKLIGLILILIYLFYSCISLPGLILSSIPFSSDDSNQNNSIKPKLIYSDLSNNEVEQIIDSELRGKSGIYSIRCDVTNEQYIGSAIDLFKRFKEPLHSATSNIRLKRAMKQSCALQ